MTQQPKQVQYQAGHTFVPAIIERKNIVTTIPTLDHSALLPQAAHSGHARQDDDAITHAKATLLVSSAYVVASALITVGLLLIIWLYRGLGEGWAVYTFTGLIVWGLATLAALWSNRKQSLWHSSTGIAHAEIGSRERIARHAIDTHAGLLLKRWEIDNE